MRRKLLATGPTWRDINRPYVEMLTRCERCGAEVLHRFDIGVSREVIALLIGRAHLKLTHGYPCVPKGEIVIIKDLQEF